MSMKRLLETFDGRPAASTVRLGKEGGPEADLAAVRSEGYEAGYASGWEDAHRSDNEARRRVAAELERNIESLAFTYHEAVDLVRSELFGFIDAVIETFLPSLIPEMTRELVRDTLRQLGEEALHAPVELVSSSDSRGILAELLEEDFSIDLSLVEDDTLAPCQVFVRLAGKESAIDLMPLVVTLKAQFSALQAKELKVTHG